MDSPAMFRRLAADGTQFPTRPGTPWPTATHTTVVTASGARYEFREHGARVYVTSRGSTAGSDLSNALLRGGFPLVTVGRPMLVFSGEQGVRITMPVTGVLDGRGERVMASLARFFGASSQTGNARSMDTLDAFFDGR